MEMTVNEIVADFNRATEKEKMITVLSMMNGCSVHRIRQILTENGVTDLPNFECGNLTEDYRQELKHYRTAGELLEEPDDMTREERDRLVRIWAIPELVKILVHKEIGRITAEIMERERQRDTLIDYLNGESENGRGNEGH